MTKSDKIENCDEKSQLMIGSLLYQNKADLYESPLEHDDRISLQEVFESLRSNGFNADKINDYNFDDIDVSVVVTKSVTQTTTSTSDKGNYAYKLKTICNIYPAKGGR